MNSNSKKNLITGARGFIGSHLANALIKSGYKINAFDFQNNSNSNSNSLYFFRENTGKIIFFLGNIEYPKSLDDAVKGVDHVFHLAARSFIPDRWENPYDFYNINVIGTANVLDTCKQNNCSLTYISSYVYGAQEYFPIDEKYSLKSCNPYSHSKLILEDIKYCIDYYFQK
jgi:nucleoside-diphosphate-sugar epimerase